MKVIRAAPRFRRTVHAVAELMARLRIDSMFVGHVAEAAWLGPELARGPVDVVAVMNPEQKNQVAMMASTRGFRVDRDEIEATEELDVIPLNFVDAEGEVRVHVLVASNALYGRMVAAAVQAAIEEREVKIPQIEDFGLMLLMAEREEALSALVELEGFDHAAFEAKLASIGLGGTVRPE